MRHNNHVTPRVKAVLSRLHGVKPVRPATNLWEARCPVHGGCAPTLDIIAQNDGAIHLRCGVGCDKASIVEALGLTLEDLAPPRPGNGKPRALSHVLQAALFYAELGHPVFPCAPGAKTPLTEHGFHDATTDAERVKWWWMQHPTANVAIATAGLLVVDIDGPDNAWPGDPERLYDLTHTAISLTPGGGRHYFFRQPAGKAWRCTQSKLAPRVDVKGDGGYIVAPPSVRPDGAYRWVPGHELDVPPERLPEPPLWLIEELDRLAAPLANGTPRPGHGVADLLKANVIPEGQRNSTLFRLAGAMRRYGLTADEIFSALSRVNADRCQPPLDPREVERIAASVARYEPDQISVALVENHWGQLVGRPAAKPEAGPILTCFADVEPREVSWLWFGRIAMGRVTLIVGRPGEGKSFLTLDAAARVSTGTPWPDGEHCPRGDVMLLTAEDDPSDTIRPRLDAHYADVRRVHLLKAVRRVDDEGQYERLITLADVDVIEAAIAKLPDCKLIVVDPIGSFLGGGTDAHRDNEVRSVLAPLAALAERYGVAVLVVAHRRKSAGGFADDLALGSRAFTGIARAVWHLSRDPDNKARRLLLPGKNNLAREVGGLAFSIIGEPARIAWERDPVEMSADDALAAENQAREKKPGPEAEALDGVLAWLSAALASGPRLAKELKDEWINGQGGSERTLKRAKQALGVEAYRLEVPGPWWWRLPAKGAKPTKGEQLGPLGPLAKNTGNLLDFDANDSKGAKFQQLGPLGAEGLG